jgi:1,2-diacylglycerol 3-alpha-glucosyltransferase
MADAPLRIAFFSDTYSPQVNGVAVLLRLLVSRLRAAGHTVVVFAPHFRGYREKENGVYRLPSLRYTNNPPFDIALAVTPGVARALRQGHFDVLHFHSPLTTGWLASFIARLARLPLICTYHTDITEYTHYLGMLGKTRLAMRATRWYSRLTSNLSTEVIAPSVKIEHLLRKQNVRRPIQVIPSGIDLDTFYQPTAPHGQFRLSLGLGPETPLLLFVGRLAPEKRLDILLEAFGRVVSAFPEARLVLAGDGSARSRLQKQAAASGYGKHVIFLGMVNRAELPGLYHDADLFVSASTSETQCIAVVEAIASRLPVVAVHDQALDGRVVDGFNGRLVPQQAEPFSAAINHLLADRATREAFGRASVELSRRFSVDDEVASLVSLYRRLIAERAAWS